MNLQEGLRAERVVGTWAQCLGLLVSGGVLIKTWWFHVHIHIHIYIYTYIYIYVYIYRLAFRGLGVLGFGFRGLVV